MSDPRAHIAMSAHDTLTDDLRRIRIGLPMDAALFGEVMSLITDRWPGTTVTGDGHHFTLQLPPEPTGEELKALDEEIVLLRQAGPVELNPDRVPDIRVIHEGQIHLLPKDESKLWATDRGYRIRWEEDRKRWHFWRTDAPDYDPQALGFHRWLTDEDLNKWVVPNQYPVRAVDR